MVSSLICICIVSKCIPIYFYRKNFFSLKLKDYDFIFQICLVQEITIKYKQLKIKSKLK